MARQEIVLGTPPQGLGGDPPRTASMKINAMTQELFAALGAVDGALPVALPPSKGGTGNTTGTAAKLAAAAMVGTVSQSSGLPTGAIFERGSNANGEYTKFADGTMYCSRSGIPMAATANTTIAGAYTFPAVFASKPLVLPGVEYPTANDSITVSRISGFSSTGSAGTIQFKADVTQTYMVSYVAIGRWY